MSNPKKDFQKVNLTKETKPKPKQLLPRTYSLNSKYENKIILRANFSTVSYILFWKIS